MTRFMIQKEYKSKRLILRRLSASDYEHWCRSQERSLPAKTKFDIEPRPKERCTTPLFMKTVKGHQSLAKGDRVYIWNIFIKKTGEIVGHIDIATVSRNPHQMANLGFYVINSYRGNGYATEAIQAIVPAAFKDLKFHRLEASIDTDNRPAIALAKKSDLYREGIKKNYWFQNGQWEDQVVFIATPELFK